MCAWTEHTNLMTHTAYRREVVIGDGEIECYGQNKIPILFGQLHFSFPPSSVYMFCHEYNLYACRFWCEIIL